MRIIHILLACFLLTSCSTAAWKRIPPRSEYTAPIGNLKCGGYPLDGALVHEAIGPHGGTIRIRDSIREVRFDVDELEPKIDGSALASMKGQLYQSHLEKTVMPLIQKGSPGAAIIDSSEIVINANRGVPGLPVRQSAVLMPASSLWGGKESIIRAQVQYTNGRHMFTASHVSPADPNWSREKQLDAAYQQLLIGLSWCSFPQ